MREKLTLSQFKSKIDSARCSFSLKSSDQGGYRMRDEPYRLNMRFTRLLVSYRPDTICLISDAGSLVFNCVRYVIYDSNPMDGDAYVIVCENYISGGISSYVLRSS